MIGLQRYSLAAVVLFAALLPFLFLAKNVLSLILQISLQQFSSC